MKTMKNSEDIVSGTRRAIPSVLATLAASGLMSLASVTTEAVPITVEIRGVVESVDGGLTSFSVGDALTARFTYDSKGPDGNPSGNVIWLPAGGSAGIGTYNFDLTDGSVLEIGKDYVVRIEPPPLDQVSVLGVVTGPTLEGLVPSFFRADLITRLGLIDDITNPPLDPLPFEPGGAFYLLFASSSANVQGTLTEFRVIPPDSSPVPDASDTLPMIALTLLGLAALGRVGVRQAVDG